MFWTPVSINGVTEKNCTLAPRNVQGVDQVTIVFALSYTGNDWNLTANVIYGIQLDQVTNRPQISACPAPFGFNGCNPDFINVDLTATKKFGNWEVGPVAYGNADLTRPIAGYQRLAERETNAKNNHPCSNDELDRGD